LLASIEPYYGPFESLRCGAPADVVMGEFWNGVNGHSSVKVAASIAHIYGKSVVGAESFTSGREVDRWQSDPASLKSQGDAMFCQGINRFIFHRYAMQPWLDRWPGMTMGPWGFHFERTLTWWNQGKAWIEYITRSQFLLQRGRSVADVASFCGENALQWPSIEIPLPPGYDYDGVNADVLLNHATVKDGLLVLDSGMSYRVLVLPQQERAMTPGLLRKLRGFVADGLTLVGAPPERSQGLGGYPESDAEVRSLAAEMWGDCDGGKVTEHRLGKGRVFWGQTMARVLTSLGVKKDFEFPAGVGPLAFIHRVDGDTDIYFVSNQGGRPVSADCIFRVDGKVPELWHPDTGRIGKAPVWREENGLTTVPLSFDPTGSIFVVFHKRSDPADHVVGATYTPLGKSAAPSDGPPAFGLAAEDGGAVKFIASMPGSAELKTASGKTLRAEVRDIPKPLDVAGPWEVNFPPNWGAPAQIHLPELVSWTEYPDDGVKYFSGTATYAKEVDVPPDMLGEGKTLWLNLGIVKNLAEVSVNGKPLGVLWKPPFRADITGAAKSGKNRIEIKITNLWPNRLIGDEQLPPDCEWEKNGSLKRWPQWLLDGKPSPTGRLTFTTWHLWKKDDKPLPSGLLGPVNITSSVEMPAN